MTEMHQISHSMVHAFLARLSNPTVVLAAFSIALAFNMAISAANQVTVQGGISFITDRTAFWLCDCGFILQQLQTCFFIQKLDMGLVRPF